MICMKWKFKNCNKEELQLPMCTKITAYLAESFTSANGVTLPKGTLHDKKTKVHQRADSNQINDYFIQGKYSSLK